MPLTRAILEGENPCTTATSATIIMAMHFMVRLRVVKDLQSTHHCRRPSSKKERLFPLLMPHFYYSPNFFVRTVGSIVKKRAAFSPSDAPLLLFAQFFCAYCRKLVIMLCSSIKLRVYSSVISSVRNLTCI